jgi:hypothetical protein
MDMEIIIGTRHTGRTNKLIELCHEAENRREISYIVVRNHQEAFRVSKKAEELGMFIAFPITYDEFWHGQYAGHNITNFFIDNVELLLQFMCKGTSKIAAITITKESDI